MAKKRARKIQKVRKTKLTAPAFEPTLKEGTKEKLFLIGFLIVAIVVMIFLFRAPTPSRTPSLATVLEPQLSQVQYNPGEYLKGTISLQLQEGDLLPAGMNLVLLVKPTVETPCQRYWLCKSGKTVKRKDENCSIIEPDPETACCFIYGGVDCWQLIKDPGFERSQARGLLLPEWNPSPWGSPYISVDVDERNENSTSVASIDSSTSGEEVAIWQSFSPVQVKTFKVSCSDTDGGINLSVKGTCEVRGGSGNIISGPHTDSCQANGLGLIEWFCEENTCKNMGVSCLYGCSDGKCVTFGVSPGGIGSIGGISCYDTDRGKVYNVKGTCEIYNASGNILMSRIDSCQGSNVTEWYCEGNTCKNESILCSNLGFGYGCSEGRCTQILGGGGGGLATWPNTISWNESNLLYYESYSGSSSNPGLLSPLSWYVKYSNPVGLGCAFEVMVKGKSTQQQPRRLHYYYSLPSCPLPQNPNNQTDRYLLQELPSLDSWMNYSQNIYLDWTNATGWSENDTINEIWLISHGKSEGYNVYGQRVEFDEVKLQIASEPSSSCIERGKKCCPAGEGFGNYYGEQLSCETGKECWEKCAESKSNTLGALIPSSYYTNPANKRNATTGPYTCTGCMNLSYPPYLGGSGEGYAACLDTSSSAPPLCRGWDNIYNFDLSKFRLKAPSENGSYLLVVQLRWTLTPPNEIVFYETSAPFSVGAVAGVPGPPTCTPNWVNCTNVTKCDASTNYLEINITQCIDANNCSSFCPPDICKEYQTGNRCEPTLPACTKEDYSCEWPTAVCGPDESQESTSCTLIGTCNQTHPESVVPPLKRLCSEGILEWINQQYSQGSSRSSVKSELIKAGWSTNEAETLLTRSSYGAAPKKKFPAWLLWSLVAAVCAGAIVLIALRLRKVPKVPMKEKEVSPELLAYCRDALAAGATRAEIASRLVEAGWPRDAVDKALRQVK